MVTPDKTTKFDEYYSPSNDSLIAANTRSKKKRGGWTRNQTTTNTDKKVQSSSDSVKVPKEVTIVTPPEQKKDLVQKKQADTKEDKKTHDVSTPVLTDSNQVAAPSIDPKLFEEQHKTIEELRGEVQKQSHAVSSLKKVLATKEKEKKEQDHKENQAKLHVINLSQTVKNLNPTDSSQIGDTITPEFILQTTEELVKQVKLLETLYGISIEHTSEKLSEAKQKSDPEVILEANIPRHGVVKKLFKKVSVLHSKIGLEVEKLDTKDKRPPNDIYESFISMLQEAKTLANSCKDLKSDLIQDIDQVQKKIVENTVPRFDQDQRRGVEIVSQFYSEKQFSEDIQKHSIEHNQMRADLKDVVSHHEKIVEMLSDITHNIGTVLMDWEDDKFYDTMMEISSTLNQLPIDIQSIVISEVKESVVKGAFKHIYEAIVTFQAMARKKRKVLMGLTVPTEEPMKQSHINAIKHLADVQKRHLQELDKTWMKIAPHVEIRVEELEKKVAEGNKNIKLSASSLQTVANYESTTPEAYEENKILPYETDHEENKKSLHQLKKDLEDFYNVAEAAKQEANRTYDSYTKREGSWTTETWWTRGGSHDEEVTKLFTKQDKESSGGWRIW